MSGYGIAAGALAFQASDGGSTPSTRSKLDEEKEKAIKVLKVVNKLDRGKYLTKLEQSNYWKFIKEHPYTPRCTFSISYDYGGGIGTNVYVECTTCQVKEDITDYESW